MTERELIALGFRRKNVFTKENVETAWHYYEYHFNTFNVSLVTKAYDETEDYEWPIEIYEPKKLKPTKSLIDAIKGSIEL